MYLGPPGLMVQIPDPQPGVKMTASRNGNIHTTLQGGQRVDYPGKAPRTYEMSWTDLNDDDYHILERLYLRQYGVGPFVFIPEPARWNFLTGEQASGSETGNTGAITTSAGVLTSDTTQVHSGGRAFKWATTSTANTTFTFNAPNNALPTGFVTPALKQWCFSAWVRSNTASQSVQPVINWYSSTGSFLSATAPAATSVGTAWVQLVAQGAAPVGAVYGSVQLVHVTAAAVSLWVDDASLEYGVTVPGSHLAGRGQPLVSFTEFTEQYDWASWGGTGKHSADGTFPEVS